jgi:alkylation response protein AidB-like acyl-CoA dehydrogenase
MKRMRPGRYGGGMANGAAFPVHDPVGPDVPASVVDTAAVAAILVPNAVAADRHGVSRDAIDHLAAAGFLGSPLEPPAAQRELAEVIAGCDATTWFCWVQHQSPLRALEKATTGADTPSVDDMKAALLPDLRSGRQLAGIAFAHVRRPGGPNPVATRMPGGWRLEGTLDWVTSWDIADVVMVTAQGSGDDAGSLVSAFLPAGRSRRQTTGLVVDLPLALLSMSGTHTRPLRFEGVVLPSSAVVEVVPRDAWLAQDAVTSANANPSAFGVARGAIADLDYLAAQRADERIAALTSSLVDECRAVRRRAYAMVDDASAGIPERLAIRAASLDLVLRATTAVIVARAGAAMRSGHDAERRVREALFLQVQAQTAATRAASMDVMLEQSRRAAESY